MVDLFIVDVRSFVSVCPGRERKEGVVYNWTLTFYGSSLTPEDVTSRQEWVGVHYMYDSEIGLFW